MFVEGILLEGSRLPFLVYQPPIFMLNHHSARRELEFVDAEMDSLVETGCVVPSSSCPTVCSPLLVVCNAKGKKRLVIDLRYVNNFSPRSSSMKG